MFSFCSNSSSRRGQSSRASLPGRRSSWAGPSGPRWPRDCPPPRSRALTTCGLCRPAPGKPLSIRQAPLLIHCAHRTLDVGGFLVPHRGEVGRRLCHRLLGKRHHGGVGLHRRPRYGRRRARRPPSPQTRSPCPPEVCRGRGVARTSQGSLSEVTGL